MEKFPRRQQLNYDQSLEISLTPDVLLNQEVQNSWQEKFVRDPGSFFSIENLETLEQENPEIRLAYLSNACLQLTVTPSQVKKYFSHFPQDKKCVLEYYEETNGHATTGIEFHLFATSSPLLKEELDLKIHQDKNFSELKELQGNRVYQRTRFRFLGQHLDIAERKERAEEKLMHDYQPGEGVSGKFAEFGDAANNFVNASLEAYKLQRRGDHRLDTTKLFTSPEYQSLPDHKKARMLRKCLEEIQFVFIFEEVYNSEFSEVYMKRHGDNRPSSQDPEDYTNLFSAEESLSFARHRNFNVAHSYLYNTRQGSKSYDEAQSFFEYEMNSTAATGGYVEEYPNHRLCLAILEEFNNVQAGKDENTEYLVEFWNKNRNPIFANAITKALDNQNAELAAGLLMELVQKDTTPNKNALAAILYRLELGRIGISEEGVKYLERLYDLGDMNNPDFFVKRLTGKGQMGVFDEEGGMRGMFDLGDLTNKEEEITAEVYQLTYDLLFVPKENETVEEKRVRNQILKEFKQNYFDFYGEKFHEQTGVHFNNLDLREQGAFMHFVQTSSEEEGKIAFDFVKNHQENGLRIFVAHLENPDMGTILSRLSKKLDPLQAQELFKKYGSFVSTVNNIEEFLEREFGFSESSQMLINKISKSLLQQGEELLRNAVQESVDQTKLLERARNLSSASLIFLTTLRSLKTEQIKPDLENITSLSLIPHRDGEKIESETIEAMKELYRQNYQGSGYPEFTEKLLENLEKRLSDPNTEFFTLFHQGELKAFNSFTQQEDGSLYWGSFNVDPDYQSVSIGSLMMQATVDEKVRHHTLEADCMAFSPIGSYYIEKFGHVATAFYGGEDMPASFHIIRNDTIAENLVGKQASQEQIIEWAAQKSAPPGIEIYHSPNNEFLPFEDKLENGKILTRYFYHSETERWVALFEDTPDDLEVPDN